MADIASLIVEVKSDGVQQTEKDLKNLGDQATKTATQTEQVAKKAKVVKGNFRAMRGSTQQVSYQLQDIAVQAQMGTNAFTILGQQGPQLASAFGPGGAVAGAVIAFGAILGGLAYKLLTAGKTSEELGEAIRGLGLEFNELSAAQQELIRNLNDIEIRRLTKENEKLAEATKTTTGALGLAAAMSQKATDSFDDMNGSLNRNQVQIGLNEAAIKKLTDENSGLSESTQKLIDKLDKELSVMGLSNRERDIELAKRRQASDEQIREINLLYDLIEGKEGEIEARDKNKKALEAESKARDAAIKTAEKQAGKRLEAALAANDTQIQSLERNLTKQLELLEQDRLAAMAAAEAKGQETLAIELQYLDARVALQQSTEGKIADVKERFRQEELRRQMIADQERIQSQQNVTNSLLMAEDVLLQGKSESVRAAARIGINLANQEKRENATKIISDSYAAAMGAYKALAGIPVIGPALGAAAAGTILAAGTAYATQSLAGRALGGQVRGGESYLVGERGPELLTMGGSGRVSSNDQLKKAMGGGESIQIVNNVDARGSSADVDMKIRSAMQQTSQQTVATIQDLMRRRRFV
jgi:hypothetical protein